MLFFYNCLPVYYCLSCVLLVRLQVPVQEESPEVHFCALDDYQLVVNNFVVVFLVEDLDHYHLDQFVNCHSINFLVLSINKTNRYLKFSYILLIFFFFYHTG